MWWARGGCELFELFELARLAKIPVAIEAVRRIDELFGIERDN